MEPNSKSIATTLSKDKELELVNNVTKSLEDFEPQDSASKNRLTEALARLATDVPLDLAKMDERELMKTDTVAQARRLYVGSLLRLWHYLARPPYDIGDEEKQARVALGFIKHAEGSRSLSVHLGRTVSDETLAEEVDKLKQDLMRVMSKRKTIDAQVSETTEESRAS